MVVHKAAAVVVVVQRIQAVRLVALVETVVAVKFAFTLFAGVVRT
jgi:hypothetical protein